MKGLALLLLLACGSASASTITLGPSDCGIVKQCNNVPNDAAADIDLYGAPQYQFFYVHLDGVLYKANQAMGFSGDHVLATDPSGNVLYITYSFTTYVTCIRSGRGQHCSSHWVLTSGATITDSAVSPNYGKFE